MNEDTSTQLRLWHIVAVFLVQLIGLAITFGALYGHFDASMSELTRRVAVVEGKQDESTAWRARVMESLGEIKGEIEETGRETRIDH